MSLVWTFTVIVPFIKGTNYGNGSCSLAGINGVPPVCRNHTYFNKINLFTNNGVSYNRGQDWWRVVTHFQKWCKEDEFCDEMISQSDCIQFYVKSDDKFFILHEDEIDITGMCQDQIHCSGILSKIHQVQSLNVEVYFFNFDLIVDVQLRKW